MTTNYLTSTKPGVTIFDLLSEPHEIVNFMLKILKHIYKIEPVSVKTGLNDIEMKIQKTILRERINFFECFQDYHYLLLRYGLWNHAGSAVSVYGIINVMHVCFDVNAITFVFYVLLVHVKQNNSDKVCVFSF